MTLDEYLSENAITESAFAERIGRHQSSIHRIRRGLSYPDWETVRRISEATAGAVTPNDFLASSDIPRPSPVQEETT